MTNVSRFVHRDWSSRRESGCNGRAGPLRRRLLVLCVVLLLLASGADAQDVGEVEIRSTDLGGGLYMLTGAGGNMGLSIGSDGAFLIDDQLAPLTQKIQAKVAALGAPGVRFVINTHWHGDHTGGNENLGTAGSLIFAHENVRARMSSEQFMAALDRRVPASPPAALPVVTFETSVTLHLNGNEIHVFHLDPAHTDGDSVVHFREANLVHSGDAYVAGMYPFIDISSGGRLDGIVVATDRILAIADAKTRIIPGHGPLSNREELEAWRAMLVDIRQRVRVAIAAGSPKDEVIASRPSADFDARYGGGFMQPDVFVGLVYESLSEP